MKRYSYFILSVFLSGLIFFPAAAQNYQALHGSSFAGALSANQNPASIVHVPHSWDITPLALQFKQTTNAVKLINYSLLSSAKNLLVQSEEGTRKRFAFANQDIRLLHARVKLSPKHTIAFGASLRSYAYFKTSAYNWQDSIGSLFEFMDINTTHTPLSGELRVSNWIELAGTYARTIKDDGLSVLNAGITLRVNKSIGGAYAFVSDLNYSPEVVNNSRAYSLRSGNLQYGYAAAVDAIDSTSNFASAARTAWQSALLTIGADIGIEYILPAEKEGDEENLYNYTWKIGVSVMDIGYNSFRYGSRSRSATAGKNGLYDTVLNRRFSSIPDADAFADSLAAVSELITPLNGTFSITQPTRLVINADRHLFQDFYLNAGLTIPLTLGNKNAFLAIRDMNLLAVTPRYETRRFGLYLPVTFNTQKQLWVGGAFKAGPLLFGLHNWANLFSKNKMHRGGLYLAVTIRPGSKREVQRSARQKLPARLRRSLGCPVL